MRILASFAATCCLVLGSSAHASLFYGLTWTQNVQGIAIEITGTDTNSDSVTDTGTGSCVDTVPAHVQTQITCPTGLVNASAGVSGNSYSVSLTMATANRGIPGMITVRAAFHAAKGVNASMLTAGKTTLVKVPISIGAEGRRTGYFTVLGVYHFVTVDFYAWTPHTVTFTGLTSKFAPLPTPTVVAIGSFDRHPPGGGDRLTLVAPSRISIDGPLAQRRTASFTQLKLFLPEPSALWFLVAGAAGLAIARIHSNRRIP